MMAMKPLMLKDFLEIDANSDSSDGFGCAPSRPGAATVRSLLDADLRGRLIRSRSRGALTSISAVLNAFRLFSSAASAHSPSGSRQSRFLPRSISKRLRRSLCKSREEEVESVRRVRVRDIVRLRSFEEGGDERRSRYFPSPVVSSCSSSSSSEDGDSSGSDFLLSSCGSSVYSGENDVAADGGRRDSPKKSFSPSANAGPEGRLDVGAADDYQEEAAGGREAKKAEVHAMECQKCNSNEEKEQLSPTSIMDFPYGDEADQEEEEETVGAAKTPPCFHETFANIERTRHQLLQKIRRFESIAELDPVDLDARFASLADPLESSDHVASDAESSGLAAEEEEVDSGTGTGGEERAWGLLRQLESRAPWGPQGCWSVEKLLVDFFVEGLLPCSLGCSGGSPLQWRRRANAESHRVEDEELLNAASDWLGGGGGGCGANYGDAELTEMERNGRWRCFENQEEDLAADLEGSVLRSLLEELVLDLVSC